MLSHTVPWLFAATPDATARVRLAGPLPPGTVVARQPGGDRYERHDPSGLEPARGVIYRVHHDGNTLRLTGPDIFVLVDGLAPLSLSDLVPPSESELRNRSRLLAHV